MPLFSELKKNAAHSLRGHRGKAACVTLITGAASVLPRLMLAAALYILAPIAQSDPAFAARYGFDAFLFERFAATPVSEVVIVFAFALLDLLLLAPLSLGATWWFAALTQGQSPPLSAMFRCFTGIRRYTRALHLELQLLTRTFLWSIPLFLPPGCLLCISVLTAASPTASREALAFASVAAVLSAVLLLLAAVLYVALIHRYALAAFLVCEDDTVTVRSAIRDSVRFTCGCRFSLFRFSLSFAGWLSLCVFAVPALFVLPYLNTARLEYCRRIAEKRRHSPPEPTREFGPAHPPIAWEQADLDG